MRRVVISLFLVLFTGCSGSRSLFLKDRSLIVPGKSAEGFFLGDKLLPVSSVLKPADVIGEELKKVIKDIINSDFDHIYYIKDYSIIFLKEDRIVAIGGLQTEDRVTIDAQKLADGALAFVIAYGNRYLKIIRDNENKIYLYEKYGIAVFDDLSDDSIDMYIVFFPR